MKSTKHFILIFSMVRQAHCNCMSVGIFSWSMLEPSEGEYHYEALDCIIEALAAQGVKMGLYALVGRLFFLASHCVLSWYIIA